MRISLPVAACVGLMLAAGAAPAKAEGFDFGQVLRGSVGKSLPHLQKSGDTFLANTGKDCFSCHHQSLPVMALSLASQRGLGIDKASYDRQLARMTEFLESIRTDMEQAATSPEADARVKKETVDPAMTFAYLLGPMADAGIPAGPATAAAVNYIPRLQLPDGSFPVIIARPPQESSYFTATALVVRGMNHYATPAAEPAIKTARQKALNWLLKTRARSTEDKTFRLLGLRWAGATEEQVTEAALDLREDQRDDGGWSQRPGMESDAYSTGQALVALHRAAGLSPMDPVYTRGAGYLVGTQKPDGTWFVQTRTPVFQPHFDTDFPHGKSQFISAAGTSWAVMALAHALPPGAAVAAR